MLVLGAGAGGVACICEGVYFRIMFPDSEAMRFSLQVTVSCLRALSRQVAGARCWCCELGERCACGGDRVPVLGAGCRCWCCELAVHVVDRVPVLVLGAGCARGGDRVPGAGAGCRCWVLAGGDFLFPI